MMDSICHLNQAAFVLLSLFTTVICQGNHQMLIENCNWLSTNWVMSTDGSKVNVAVPFWNGNHNLVANLVCRTRFYNNDIGYKLKVTVNKFDLLGPDDCRDGSEMMILQFSGYPSYKNVTWCGRMFAEEVILPRGTVNLIYTTGAFGEGSGFDLDVSAVPKYQCYSQERIKVRTQSMILYSPNYPGNYESHMRCTIFLEAEKDHYIHITTQLIEIENSLNCLFDALIIDNVRYCGNRSVDFISNSSSVEITFESDGDKELSGFALKYKAIPVEIIQCTSSSPNFTLQVSTFQLAVVMENQAAPDSRSIWCKMTLDSGSDLRVVALTLPPNLDSISRYSLVVPGEQGPTKAGGIFITDMSGPRPYKVDGQTTLNFLRSSGRRIEFSALLTGERFTFKVQAVDKASLPETMKAEHALLWIDSSLVKGTNNSKMRILVDDSKGKNIEIGVFDLLSENITLESDTHRRIVSSYVSVYNGEDPSYFDLTLGCDLGQSNLTSVYSFFTQNITVVFKRNTSSRGYWLYVGPSKNTSLPRYEITSLKYFSLDMLRMVTRQTYIRNLYCTWALDQDSQADLVNKQWLIRLKVKDNFDDIYDSFIKVTDEEQDALIQYGQGLRNGDLWLYSATPLFITVSMFDTSFGQQVSNFEFTYEILKNWSGLDHDCQPQKLTASKTIQFVSTPNYPNYFRSTLCEWTIKKNPQENWDRNIVVEIPDLYHLYPYFRFLFLTSNNGDDYVLHDQHTLPSTLIKHFREDMVKIRFSSNKRVQPGFRFAYYTEEVSTVNNCNTNVTLRDGDKFILHGTFLASSMPCTYYLNASNYSVSLIVKVIEIKFRLGPDGACGDSYIDVFRQNTIDFFSKVRGWTPVIRLCGKENELMKFSLSQLPVFFNIHWSSAASFTASFVIEVAVKQNPYGVEALLADSSDRYFASPNYPSLYPNQIFCEWAITTTSVRDVIELELLDFTLENEFNSQCPDYVEIYDGPNTASQRLKILCGIQEEHTFQSSGPDMTVVFQSDQQNNYRGFNFRYRSENKAYITADDQVSGIDNAVILIIVAIICVILLILMVTICVVRRRIKQRRNGHNRTSRQTAGSREPITYVNSINPPPYPGITIQLPPYSRTADSNRCVNYEDQGYDPPPPYSFDLPDGPARQEQYLELSNSRLGSSSDDPAEQMLPVTEVDPRRSSHQADQPRENPHPYSTVGAMVTANFPVNGLHQSFHFPTQQQPLRHNNIPLEDPPSYENEAYILNDREQVQDHRTVPLPASHGRLGPL